MNNIRCAYVSGASIVFSNEDNGSTFYIAVVPPKDQFTQKEIVAICDNKPLKKGLIRPANDSRTVLKEFSLWGANPENLNQASDFLNMNLQKKEEPRKIEKSYSGEIGKDKIGGNYTFKKEF